MSEHEKLPSKLWYILRALSSLVTLDHIAAADPQKGPPRNQFSVSKHPRSFLYFLKEEKRTGREEMSLYKSRGNKAIKAPEKRDTITAA